MVRRRDLRQGQRCLAIRVPGGRPARAGHRRAGLGPPRRRRGPAVLEELIPSVWHHVEQYANNPIEADHSRLKHRLRPMRGLPTDRTAQMVIAGHAFMQNLKRGHYELGIEAPSATRVSAAFTELAQAI